MSHEDVIAAAWPGWIRDVLSVPEVLPEDATAGYSLSAEDRQRAFLAATPRWLLAYTFRQIGFEADSPAGSVNKYCIPIGRVAAVEFEWSNPEGAIAGGNSIGDYFQQATIRLDADLGPLDRTIVLPQDPSKDYQPDVALGAARAFAEALAKILGLV